MNDNNVVNNRRATLLNNANTLDYTESYEKTRPYDTLLGKYELEFEPYILSINSALEYFADRRHKPFIASPEQARVIYSLAPRIGVVASAGSGKTTTIIRKLYLNRTVLGWTEGDILAITYTNDSARSMRESYRDMISSQSNPQLVDFKTIHKFGKEFIEIANPNIKLISEDSPLIEYHFDNELSENIETMTSMYDILRKAIKQNGIDVWGLQTGRVVTALSVISEKMIMDEETFKDSEQFMDFPLTFDQLMAIKHTYTLDKNAKGCMDYVDMLEAIHAVLSSLQTLDQLQDERLRRHVTYKAVYLDEAQDVSPLQISIINHILRLNKDCQLVVVGDDDQSIFGFRGANPDYLVNLQDQYPMGPDNKEELEIIYMTYNRRSAPLIVNTMNKVISHNTMRYDKEAKAFNTELEGNIDIIKDFNNTISTSKILAKAKELYRTQHSARDMAVLYREHSQVRTILNKLIEERIPFNMNNKPNDNLLIHNHFVVRDILGIMQTMLDLNSHYNIEKYLHKLCPYMGYKVSKDISEEMVNQSSLPVAKRKKLSTMITERGKGESNQIILTCLNLVKDSDFKEDNIELITTIYEYYKKAYLDWYLRDKKDMIPECDEALEYLLTRKAIGYQGLKDEVLEDRNWTNSNYNFTLGVKLRTFHTSKGLEWKNVFLLPISNKVSPKSTVLSKLSQQGALEYVEEERRLFYVACTRAISDLTVFYEQDGTGDENIFIKEIKEALAETKVTTPKPKPIIPIEPVSTEQPVEAPCMEERKSKIVPMPECNI